jgi:hypothetical protein
LRTQASSQQYSKIYLARVRKSATRVSRVHTKHVD